MKKGFDCEKYINKQYKHILERIDRFNNKLYLEFGGKLFYDYHASRVLPGFDPTAKIKLLEKLKDKLEIIICIYAGDIEQNKIRADFGTSYSVDTMRLIDDLRNMGLDVNSVVITRYDKQPSADIFIQKLNRRGVKTYTHGYTKGYPTDVDIIVSDEGYGANPYIETTKPLVVVTAPGPGSGKLATCLSQIYHEHSKGSNAGYAKFETFPIWNLPLSHPVNVAYEAATVDLKDINLIDSFHLEKYGKTTINYNRDIEAFPVLKRIFEKITNKIIYNSPTDMGVNMAGYGIIDDEIVRNAAKDEIIRRYFYTKCDYKKGLASIETVKRAEFLLSEMDLKPESRRVVLPAREASKESKNKNLKNPMGLAISLENDEIITSRGSFLMNSAAALIINAIKKMANIDDDIHIISPSILEPIVSLKKNKLNDKCPILDIEEILIALSISTTDDENAKKAYDKLHNLHGLEAHSSAILSDNDERMIKNLGINITCDANFVNNNLIY